MEKPTGRSTEQPAEQRAEQPAERPAGQQVERTAWQPTDNAPSDDALRRASARVRAGRVLQMVAIVLVACEVAAIAAGVAMPLIEMLSEGPLDAPLLLGPVVMASAGMTLLVLIALLPWILLGISIALRCSADPAVRCSARASRPVEVARNAAGVVAALVMVPLVGLALLLATVDEGYVAGEPSEAGDRVVIVEHHFLLLSSGDVYLVPAGSVTGECIASFSCDDTYSPGYAGSYRVTWNGRSPHVQVWSDSAVDGMVPLDIEASSADAS